MKNDTGKRKLKASMTEEEILKLLDYIPANTCMGLRDKAIFKLIYHVGLQIEDILQLKLSDIDLNLKEIYISHDGLNNGRIFQFDKVAKNVIEEWITHGRAWYLKNDDTDFLFINRTEGKLTKPSLNRILKKYLDAVKMSQTNFYMY